jgi:hypothetical protein
MNVDNRYAARDDDRVKTCNDPEDLPVGRIISNRKVFIGR